MTPEDPRRVLERSPFPAEEAPSGPGPIPWLLAGIVLSMVLAAWVYT